MPCCRAKNRRPAGVSFDSTTPSCGSSQPMPVTLQKKLSVLTYLWDFHVHQLGAEQLADGLVSPADAAELLPRMVRDHIEDELVDAQDPRVPLARVGVSAANDDQVEGFGVGEAISLLGRVEEDELGIGADGADGADVRVADLGDDGRAVRVEEDGDPQGAVVGWAHVE